MAVLLVGIGGMSACSREAAIETDSGVPVVPEGAAGETTPELPGSAPLESDGATGDGMPMVDSENLSPERKATLSAWAATQSAVSGEGVPDFGALMADLESAPTALVGGVGSAPGEIRPGMIVPTILDDYGIEMETDYDPLALEAAIGLFRSQVGQSDADIQNVGLYVLSPFEFSSLRGTTPMPSANVAGSGTAENIWIAVFDTSETVIAGTFLPENIDELGDIGPEAELAGPNGLTTVYYILSLSGEMSGGRFLALSKGVLNDRTSWTRADLEAIDID